MTRAQLAHVLRAAASISGDPNILVVGSQAILGSHAEDELPELAWISIEARARCVEKHDLVISKLAALREKDKEFARALLDAGLVDVATLLERVDLLNCVPKPTQHAVRMWLEGASRRTTNR